MWVWWRGRGGGGGAGHADGAEDGREETFLAGGVDEAAAREGGDVQGAEAAGRDHQGEDEGAGGADDARAEGDGDGVGGSDRFGGEDEGVGEGGEEVGENDEGHGGVDDAGEVPCWVPEFAQDEVGVVPAVEGPEASVEGDGPIGGVAARAGEPGFRLPVLIGGVGGEGAVCDRDDEAGDGDGEESEEFEEHKEVAGAGGEFGGDAIQGGDDGEAEKGDAFVDPYDTCADVWKGVCGGGRRVEGADNVFSEDDGDDSCRTGFEDEDRAPGEEEAEQVAEDFCEVNLCSAVERDGSTELSVRCCTRPSKNARHEPYQEGGTRRASVCRNLSWRGKDAGANDEANNEGKPIEICYRFVLFQTSSSINIKRAILS